MRRYCLIVLLLVGGPRSEAKYSGGRGTADDPYLLSTARDVIDLAADANDWSQCFRQTTDIDMNGWPGNGAGTIGNEDIPFSGVFNGDGKTLAHFTCTYEGANGIGLFGQVRGYDAEIRNVVLIDPHVEAPAVEYVGALVGRLRSGAVTHCRVRGARVSGHMGVGGLIGWNQGAVSTCEVTGTISGALGVGGLVGVTFWGDAIQYCRTDVIVTGTNRVGGFAGNCALAEIHGCSAGGRVEGQTNVGGFVGCSEGGILANSYATASATGASYVGGFLGRNDLSCDCSAGALPSQVIHCYATGLVRGDSFIGGLVGRNEESLVQGAFWDIEASGATTSDGGTGLTTAELQQQETFAGANWDFTAKTDSAGYWVIRGKAMYPKLAWQIVAGDFNDDGDVDLLDFSRLARAWLTLNDSFWTGGSDLDGDGFVGYPDLAALSQHWLFDCPPATR